jgi:hypothetical protein
MRLEEYIPKRLDEGAVELTVNMEVGELSRAIKRKWSVTCPTCESWKNHEVGRALSIDEKKRMRQAAAEDRSPNRNPMLCTFLRIALTTGMRSREIAALKREGSTSLPAS